MEDLREERQEVMQALLELDCIPSGMELFPAADEDQWSLIKRVIDDCDYYLVIIAGRYGSIGPNGKSYTQMEYEYATSQKKPVITFLHGEPGKIPTDKTDPENRGKLQAFRDLAQQKLCKFWTTPQELGSVVSRSIVKLIKDKPGVGWVRADSLPDQKALTEVARLSSENATLKQRVAEMETTAPPGTEQLAQGDEVIVLHMVWGPINPPKFEVTWNELFSVLAPYLLDGVFETVVIETIVEAYMNRIGNKLERNGLPEVLGEDFQRVKLQFRALDWIEVQSLPNTGTWWWTLTPYGKRAIVQVAAIRSKRSSEAGA